MPREFLAHPPCSLLLRRTVLTALGWAALAAGQAAARAAERGPPPLPARALFTPRALTAEHLRLLRQGGLVLYLRHGPSDARRPDQIPVRLDDCHSQRPLTNAGRRQLDQLSRHLHSLGIPYREVISSPFCRVVESARRVFGEPVRIDPALRYTAAMSEQEKRPAVQRTRHWLSLPLSEPALNRVVVAHGPNLAELIDYLPPEGTLVVFRPLGLQADPGFEYLASVELRQWEALLQALAAP